MVCFLFSLLVSALLKKRLDHLKSKVTYGRAFAGSTALPFGPGALCTVPFSACE